VGEWKFCVCCRPLVHALLIGVACGMAHAHVLSSLPPCGKTTMTKLDTQDVCMCACRTKREDLYHKLAAVVEVPPSECPFGADPCRHVARML